MNDLRYVITNYKGGVLSFIYDAKANALETVHFTRHDEKIEKSEIFQSSLAMLSRKHVLKSQHGGKNDNAAIGAIFMAKVINVVNQLNAAFINYAPDKRGYLPISRDYAPIITNRKYDGRILAGDEILVQLEKEAAGTKDAVFTANLSIAGRYSVVSYANTTKSVSKKCSKQEKEKLLAAIPQDIDYGVVVRTNAAQLLNAHGHEINLPCTVDVDNDEKNDADALRPLADEIMYLNDKMSELIRNGIHRTCYSCIWQPPPSYLANLRDEGKTYSRIVTDSPELYEEIRGFVKLYMPEQISAVSLYKDESYPLQKLYRVETLIGELLDKKVWLKSGAYLIIEKTEAMHVIDVNSGKNITKKDSAEYIYRINMEAAAEIMRQIRLRNLAGMILVDFINMEGNQYNDALLQELRIHAKKDKILTNIVDITALGLVEITRKRTTKSLGEMLG